MKTKLFITFLACVVASVLMSSCSEEERTANNGQPTAFAGGVVREAPMERVQIGTSDSSTVVPGFLTRTSMNRSDYGDVGTFFWEPNDAIYVEDDGGRLCRGQSTITDTVARATFFVRGSFTTKGPYKVYYCGTNHGASEKKVVIADYQRQVAFNDTKHLGEAGDCGVALAVKNTDSGMRRGYKFDLEHKASYLCFLPYIAYKEERKNYKLLKIVISSNNSISGTYDLTQAGLSTTGTNESNTIVFDVGTNGLLLADTTTSSPSIKNSLYVVIAPGTHSLRVNYTVIDIRNSQCLTLTKDYESNNYAANKICNIPIYLDYDAVKRKSGNFGFYQFNFGDWSFVDHPTRSPFTGLPSLDQMNWYVNSGDPHWDYVRKGVWLKKQLGNVIVGSSNAPSIGEGTRAGFMGAYAKMKSYGRPRPSEIKKYFFLPALGGYDRYWGSHLYGESGIYWSSSPWRNSVEKVFTLTFNEKEIYVMAIDEINFAVVHYPFEE